MGAFWRIGSKPLPGAASYLSFATENENRMSQTSFPSTRASPLAQPEFPWRRERVTDKARTSPGATGWRKCAC